DRALSIPEFQLRTAMWTCIGLRMKTSVLWIAVFGFALRAHHESFHRSIRPIVRQRFDDAEARPAIRAVRKWIAVTSIVGVENVAQAIRTCRDIWEDQGGFRSALLALANFKSLIASWVEQGILEALDHCA